MKIYTRKSILALIAGSLMVTIPAVAKADDSAPDTKNNTLAQITLPADKADDGIAVESWVPRTTIDGQKCFATDLKSDSDNVRYYISIDFDNTVTAKFTDETGKTKFPVKLSITFLDKGKRSLGIQYKKAGGGGTASWNATDTGTWKTVDVDIPFAAFPPDAGIRFTNWGWAGADPVNLCIKQVKLVAVQ